jgi:acyl-coenzyme A thioesterase PaaI-like protein
MPDMISKFRSRVTVSPASPDERIGARVYADATVAKRGRQLAMVEVAISNDAGTLRAKRRVLYAFRVRARRRAD